MNTCPECRHNRRKQWGPNAWNHDCALAQADYPHAEWCARYEPPPLPPESWECSSGLGIARDAEDWTA